MRAPSHVGGVFASFATETVGLGFESCDKDCIGASVTDLVLCVHALWTACRVWRRVAAQREQLGVPSRPWSFASLATGAILSNAGWSLLGACYWLQPGGRRFLGFEACWRLSAQCQVVLFYFAYCLGLAFSRIGGINQSAVRHETLLSRCGLAHALAFGLLCLSPHTCLQDEYVLWGGVNIMPPLLSQWAVVVRLVVRHGLHRSGWRVPGRRLPHPLLLAALSGGFYWLGNSAILFGRRVGLPLWLRRAAGLPATAENAFEEMATFHLFGLMGNELLWRGYEWVAVQEVQADAVAAAAAAADTSTSVAQLQSRRLTPTLPRRQQPGAAARRRPRLPLWLRLPDASSSEPDSDTDDDEGVAPTTRPVATAGVAGAFVVASGKARVGRGGRGPPDAVGSGGAWLERLLSEPAEARKGE